MTFNAHAGALQALGEIEAAKSDIEWISDTLERAPAWRPSVHLKKQTQEALRIIGDLEKRFERKLVVTLVGPTGSGKSTLLNALARIDDLSPAGNRRPTTRGLVILAQKEGDAQGIAAEIGEAHVRIETSPAASALDHVLLIDTPDTDSTEQENHIPLVKKAISLSDVLICVFDSENPKRKDHIDFLEPFVRVFDGESLICALNKCDRQDETELKEEILPEIKSHVSSAWNRPVQRMFCLSGRRHLRDPDWDPKATPKHDFDQFGELRELIFGTFNRAAYVIDRRVENAKQIRNHIHEAARRFAGEDRNRLLSVKERMAAAENAAVKNSLEGLQGKDPRNLTGVNVLLYQRLSQRWLGPVGWVIAIWARLLIFGTGIAAMMRFGSPVSQVAGMVSSFRHFKESRAAIAEAGKGERVDAALRDYRFTLMRDWPDIAEKLIRSRFDKSVRDMKEAMPNQEGLGDEISTIWNDALDAEIDRASKALSGFALQMLFNLPVLALLSYVGWITAISFLEERYFSGNFFLHAFLTLLIILFLCFFIFQIIVRLGAGAERIAHRAFQIVKHRTEEIRTVAANPISEQIEAVLDLSGSGALAETPQADNGSAPPAIPF